MNQEMSLTIVRGLHGLIDVDDGPTNEQRTVLGALGQHLLGIDADVVKTVGALTPQEFAAALQDANTRRPFTQMAIILELCRHPPSDTQLQQLETYCNALGMDGPELEGVRTMAHESAKKATDDFLRVFVRSRRGM